MNTTPFDKLIEDEAEELLQPDKVEDLLHKEKEKDLVQPTPEAEPTMYVKDDEDCGCEEEQNLLAPEVWVDENPSPQEEVILVVDEDFIPGSGTSLHDMSGEEEEEEQRETDWENDKDHSKFLDYFSQMLDAIPQHSGQTTVGCEKAIAFLKKLDKEMSRAIQSDDDNIIDEQEAEKLRDMVVDYIEKLEDAHSTLMDKKKKKNKKKSNVQINKKVVVRIKNGNDLGYYLKVAHDGVQELLPVKVVEPTDEQVGLFMKGEEEQKMTKEAQTAKVVLFEDPFLHSITKILVNSHVQGGKDLERVYADLKDKYDFTPREELSIQELLLQKGFPMTKDLGRVGDKEVYPWDGKQMEANTIYYA